MTAHGQRPEESGGEPPDQLAATGERIQALLEASAAGGVVARERAEELVRLVVDLYGAGLERMLDLLHESGSLSPRALEALADDKLVASLLLVHGLHPEDVQTRVERALDDVRPYLGSHGGDVELLGVSEEGVVALRLLGSCDGCPSSSTTLTLAVEGAVEAAAPEVTGFEVQTPEAGADEGGTSMIPVEALRARLGEPDVERSSGWEPVPELAELAPGEVRRVQVSEMVVLACRVGSDLYAYRDACPVCCGSLQGATLGRRVGGRAGDVVLRCPGCGAHYDVRHAGAGVEHADTHLDPLPLLTRDGVVSLAVPGTVGA